MECIKIELRITDCRLRIGDRTVLLLTRCVICQVDVGRACMIEEERI